MAAPQSSNVDSIEAMSIKALGLRMQKVFSLTSQPINCPVTDRIHIVKKLRDNKGERMVYPLVTYSMTGMQPGELGNVSAMMYRSMHTSSNRTTKQDGSIKVIPIHLVFDVYYTDNEEARTLRFLSKWQFAAACGELNFRLKVDGANFDVQVLPDTSLTVPQKDGSPDNSNHYEFQGTVSMRTYLSGPFETAIKRIAFIREFVTGYFVPPEGVVIDKGPEIFNATIESYPPEDLKKYLAFEITTAAPQPE